MYIEMVSRLMVLGWGVSGAVTRRVSRNERGEIGSWMILAAGLAIAAGVAVVALREWLGRKTTAITAN